MVTKKAAAGRVTAPKSKDVLEAPTPVSGWKKSSEGILVRVPSGNTALIRTPGIEVFLTQGVIPNALMPLITDSMKRGAAPKDDDLAAMMGNPEMVAQIVEMANAVCVYCCLDPKVEPVPEEGVGRDPELLYVDEVDFNDKMYIFSVAVGGTSDLEKFREEQAAVMGSLSKR